MDSFEEFRVTAKSFLTGMGRDLFNSLIKPGDTARKIKETADITYGLKILLVVATIFFLTTSILSFIVDNITFTYSTLTNLKHFKLDRVISGYVGVAMFSIFHLFILFFIGIPAYITGVFLWTGIYWFIGKRMGGKAGYSRFFGTMMPVQMMLLITIGGSMTLFTELIEIICTVAHIASYKTTIIFGTLGLIFLPPVYLINLFYQTIFIREVHEISTRKALITALIPLAAGFILAVAVIIIFTLFTTIMLLLHELLMQEIFT